MIRESCPSLPNDSRMGLIDDTERRHILFRCESISEMVDFAEKHWQDFDTSLATERKLFRQYGFTGRSDIHDWSTLKKAIREPWNEGVGIINGMIKEILGADIVNPRSRRRRARWSEDVGDDFDYDRMRSGQPFWRQCKRDIITSSQVIVFVVDVGASAGTNHSLLLWRGAATLAAAYLLETAGYRCEIWSARYALKTFETPLAGTRDLVTACRLKKASERIDIGVVATGISAWFYRTVMFAATNGFGVRPVEGLGLGGVKPSTWWPTQHLAQSGQPHFIHDVWDKESAIGVAQELIQVVQDPNRDRVFRESGKRRPFYEWDGQTWRQELEKDQLATA